MIEYVLLPILIVIAFIILILNEIEIRIIRFINKVKEKD